MKISRKQLQEIKKTFKEYKDKNPDSDADIENNEDKLTLRDVKRAYEYDDEDYALAARAKINKKTKRNLKKKARQERNIGIQWNFEEGDVVEFKTSSGLEYGIVISKRDSQKFRTIREAKRSGTILILTPAGKTWFSPVKLTKIEEE